MSLDPNSENTHIPYRDSKLTRVLQNSLGGNSYTIVLAAIHPHASYYEECLSTLQFANRCRNVKNNPRVNYVDDPMDKDMKIKRLTEEIALLRTKLAAAEKGGGAGGKGGKISPDKLVELLKKLGIKADLAPDGALIVNGQRHELGDLGLGGDDDDDEDEDDEGGVGGMGAGGEEGGFGLFCGMGFGKVRLPGHTRPRWASRPANLSLSLPFPPACLGSPILPIYNTISCVPWPDEQKEDEEDAHRAD